MKAYAAGGYYEQGKGLPELCAEMDSYVSAGFRAVKMKVGWSGVTLRQDAERVRAVREAVGPDISLMVDANNAWDAKTALRFGRMVEPYDPYWFEEPVHADDLRGGALLVSSLDMPIASGENENAISLGLYAKLVSAERRSNRIRALGYEPVHEPSYKEETEYWLDYREFGDKGLPTEFWELLAYAEDKLQRLERDCVSSTDVARNTAQ